MRSWWWLGIALALGLLGGWCWPRGVQTGGGAVAVVVAAWLLGVVIARHAGDGRSAALKTVAGALVVGLGWELNRLGLDLPSVSWRLDRVFGGSTWALGSQVLGRFLDALLVVLPLAVGVWSGRPISECIHTRLGRCERTLNWRAAAPLVTTGALVAGTALTLVPPSTPVTPETPTTPGHLGEVARLSVGGCEQRVVIRGRANAPVIVFFSGGPGGSEIGTLREQWAPVERDFTVVVWDQTGAGLNARCFPRDGRLRLAALRQDAATVLAWTGQRFGRTPILVGNSWGTLLGTLVVHDHPQLVRAYVGSGQMVSLAETDRHFRTDTIAWARAHGRPELADRLAAQGEPPYPTVWPYEELFAHEGDVNPWDRDPAVSAAVNPLANVMNKPEFDPLTKVRYAANIIDSFASVYPDAQAVDLRRDAAQVRVPVYLAQGVHEARGRQVVARAWFDVLEAPVKEWVDFDRSGHKAFGEEPDAFAALLRRVAAASDRRS